MPYDTTFPISVTYPFALTLYSVLDTCSSCGCSPPAPFPTDTLYIPTSEITSNHEISYLQNSLKAYPNPVENIIHIHHANDIKMTSLKIYSVNGKRLFDYHQNLEQINMTLLPKGFYYLHIYTNKGVVYKKIIKQ